MEIKIISRLASRSRLLISSEVFPDLRFFFILIIGEMCRSVNCRKVSAAGIFWLTLLLQCLAVLLQSAGEWGEILVYAL